MLAPARNILVILPVRRRCLSEKVIVMGNRDAIEKPVIIVPVHNAPAEWEYIKIIHGPITHPARPYISIYCGLTLAATGMPRSLPTVSEPQNAEVRYAATILSARPRVYAYV